MQLLQYTSSTHKIAELWRSITWELQENQLQRIDHKHVRYYPYASIEAVRLCFHMGGRGIPARYCCYLKTDGQWPDELIFSSPTGNIDSPDYHKYHAFTLALIQNIQSNNGGLVIQTGHSTLSWMMYLFFSLLFPFLPYFFFTKQVITHTELLWTTVALFLLCLPMIFSMFKYFPRRLSSDQEIPKSVLPTPK